MPPNPLYPGVYVEETPRGPHAIGGGPTGIAGFVGGATAGRFNQPARLRSFADFQKKFGRRAPGSELATAVRQFFLNGGTECHVVRVPHLPTDAHWLAGLNALDPVDGIRLLALPGVSSAPAIAAAGKWCREHFAFFILDPPANLLSASQITEWLTGLGRAHADNTAVYFPWLNVGAANEPPRWAAPAGTVAGIFARTDASRGVWRAPAGLDATLLGVQSLAVTLTDRTSADFNQQGINVLRTMPQNGTVVWGARTLAGTAGVASDFKYVSVKRLALFLQASITRGTQWATFELNGEPLWSQVREAVENFLHGLFRQGAFQGTSPKDAFFVKCDRTTMTALDLENGRLCFTVGFAPLQPAEFIILQFTQPLG